MARIAGFSLLPAVADGYVRAETSVGVRVGSLVDAAEVLPSSSLSYVTWLRCLNPRTGKFLDMMCDSCEETPFESSSPAP